MASAYQTPRDGCFCSKGSRGAKKSTDDAPNDDALLAQELNALSMEERNELFEEVHGVNEVEEESPEFVAQKINALKDELAKYPPNKRRSFDRACFLKPSLENDESFFLIFLRGQKFNVSLAASKLCYHFDHKLELFGEAKLPKKITLSDMSKDDLDCFHTGNYIVLPKKDRSGRQPHLLNIPRMKYKHWKNQVRYTWYTVYNVLLAEKETQRKGIVDVMYLVDLPGVPEALLQYVRDAHHILNEMPGRSCAFHLCYNSKLMRTFLSFLHVVMHKERRLRERLHFGSQMEIIYELGSFGIDMREDGKTEELFGKEYVDAFLADRKRQEEEEERKQLEKERITGVIPHPNPHDVLCGRGRPYQDFCGNVRLGNIIDSLVPQYLATSKRQEKTSIAISIVNRIQTEGGRFLSRHEHGWQVADGKVARGKVSQALRVRALKKVRGEGLEPSPLIESRKPNLQQERSQYPENIESDSQGRLKRQRFSDESDNNDGEESELSDFDLLSFGDADALSISVDTPW